MNKLLLLISILVSVSISCGTLSQAALVQPPTRDVSMTAVRPAVSATPIQPTETGTQTAVVIAERLNLRKEPGQWNAVILADGLPRGTVVTLTGRTDTPLDAVYEWIEVRVIVNGVEYVGWVNSIYISK